MKNAERSHHSLKEAAPGRRSGSEFDAVPGEAEADALRDAFLKSARPDPASQALALSGVDSATRARAINRLQQERGNLYVQRVVAESRRAAAGPVAASQVERQKSADPSTVGSAATLAVQRYPVPGDLACSEVVDWLDANSPYAPEWAQTRCIYTFHGQAQVESSTLPDGSVQLRARGHARLRVTVRSPIDRPQWTPSPRPNRQAEVTAWNNMRAALDAHEQQHRQIGEQWRAELERRWRAVDVTATGADRAQARANLVAALQALQQSWQAEAQAAQDAIDPFRGAVLSCPTP